MALDFLKSELPDVGVKKIDLSGAGMENRKKFIIALNKCGFESSGIPLIMVGDKCFQGFDAATGRAIKRAIRG
jgi:hypothetical protein